ncbi:MAG: rod shape-determining protein MreC [Miltoncostaeaceae bacterium]
MSTSGSGVQRRRANVRRAVIASLVVACLGLMTGYFREDGAGPLHSVQSSTAGVMAPVQEIAGKAVEPFRNGWNYVAGLRDARDRAARLERENEILRAAAADNIARDAELRALQRLMGVGNEVDGYGKVNAALFARSVTAWDRLARINKGSGDGVVRNSPVVAGSERGMQLVGVVTSVRARSADIAFITDGNTEVGAFVPEAGGNYPGLIQAITPGQLRLSMIPREARLADGQLVLTSGFVARGGGLPSIYPRGLPVGVVTNFGAREADAQATVQVTPFVEFSELAYVTVLTPESPEALRRAEG